GNVAVWLVMSYLWLPYMVLPIFAGLERIPNSLLSASEDLGAPPTTTFRRVILPLTFPAVVAGSIFTFSLTLGDYITPSLVSNNQFIGNVVFNNITNNLPLASAYTVVPIAVMVTGVALSDTFTQILGISLSLFTVIVGHATFCIVVVYNTVIACLRRMSGSSEDASADLGANSWQTFRHVTFPGMRTALVAGALLAFALSFDEIIVTTFTIGAGEKTLP